MQFGEIKLKGFTRFESKNGLYRQGFARLAQPPGNKYPRESLQVWKCGQNGKEPGGKEKAMFLALTWGVLRSQRVCLSRGTDSTQ